MSLYLSRMLVNPLSMAGMRLVESPDRLHSFVCGLFEERRQQAGALFRVDPTEDGPMLLLQSAVPPDWSRASLREDALLRPPETRPFAPVFRKGDCLNFRLLARPARRLFTGRGNEDGPRRDLRTDEERLAWIRRKGEQCGFRVSACGLTLFEFPAVHSDGRVFRDCHGAFTAVRFDGELIVTDPAGLLRAVEKGIGPQKAFGFGLLSLARAR